MKKITTAIIIFFSLTFFPLLATSEEIDDYTLNTLQEYCAKEQDPVKRLHYCNALEQYSEAQLPADEVYSQSVIV